MINVVNTYLVILLISILIISIRDFATRKFGSYKAIFNITYIVLLLQYITYNREARLMRKLNITINRLNQLINTQYHKAPGLCLYHLSINHPYSTHQYLIKDTFTYNDYKNLTEHANQQFFTKEELIIQKFTDKMKEYNHQKCMKHMAQRLFGVLLEKNIIRANSPQNRLEIYKRMTGFDKAEPYYFLNPFSSKDGSETQKFKEKIKELKEFVESIGLG